ncbi:putative lipoprotein [Candidatus Sulfotelmatomonas gaucii]|uniref:Putative lipoprotein n=1 Tax=Candidatus Sulfuritelmatomonas gaucii TaxID=2043161 RepID=A0A2N9LWM0_9BACT|nr:putative lipoprotein [Candidatus Sulfotelmatomonas gaucii]
MKSHAKCASWLLPLLITGCGHMPFHHTVPAPPAGFAPPLERSLPVALAIIELPPAEIVLPARPIYNLPPEPINPPIRHRKQKPVEVTAQEGTTNPEVSAIAGPLSSGDPANVRQQTGDSIASIERGLNGINRNLSDPERKTADQIREYLKQAKDALATGDVEGAHTLAGKAQVLLAGLSQ